MAFVFPIEAGHILTFARALGDENPAFIGSGNEEVIGPPTFLFASAQYDPDWPLRPKLGQPWIGDATAPSRGGGRLHAEQHFEYVRAIRPGDVLTIKTKPGARWKKESRRAGQLLFEEDITEARDQFGELVCIMRRVVMQVGKPAVAL